MVQKIFSKSPWVKNNPLGLLEILVIIGFAMVPLMVNFPYRVNIFLSWEGAYRLSQGHVPYKDFGIPMGFAYWMVPALFFKLFGPYMMSLVKAQVFINIISGLAFRSILSSLKTNAGVQLVAILVFCLSYSFFNFWPWYNHTVIVYGFVAIAFVLKYMFSAHKYRVGFLAAGALFSFLSFFTKQDGGGLVFLILSALLVFDALFYKNYKGLLLYWGMYAIVAALLILPFLQHDFGYWFNYGQEPHNSRISARDFLKAIFGGSKWEKFYILIIGLVLLKEASQFKTFLQNKTRAVYVLLTLGIMVEALLFQVTSYTPPDNNIFFHSFGFAFFFTFVDFKLDFSRLKYLVPTILLVFIWWSSVYWKYVNRIVDRVLPKPAATAADNNKISINTFIIKKDTFNNIGMDKWKFSKLRAFKGVYMPESTVKGMERLMQLPVVKSGKEIKVLNMTELTPLAHEMGFELEKGLPLWYHVGVGMFEKEEALYVQRIESGYYDLVMFEDIPYLNNFFPAKVHAALKAKYKLQDRFLAPRRPTDSHVEVYVRP